MIINLGRGSLIDETALVLALKNGQLRGMCMARLLEPIKGGWWCPCPSPRNILEQPIHLLTGPTSSASLDSVYNFVITAALGLELRF